MSTSPTSQNGSSTAKRSAKKTASAALKTRTSVSQSAAQTSADRVTRMASRVDSSISSLRTDFGTRERETYASRLRALETSSTMSGDWYSQLLNLNSSMQAYGSLDQERDSLARLFAKYTEQTAPPEINGTEAMNTFIINLMLEMRKDMQGLRIRIDEAITDITRQFLVQTKKIITDPGAIPWWLKAMQDLWTELSPKFKYPHEFQLYQEVKKKNEACENGNWPKALLATEEQLCDLCHDYEVLATMQSWFVQRRSRQAGEFRKAALVVLGMSQTEYELVCEVSVDEEEAPTSSDSSSPPPPARAQARTQTRESSFAVQESLQSALRQKNLTIVDVVLQATGQQYELAQRMDAYRKEAGEMKKRKRAEAERGDASTRTRLKPNFPHMELLEDRALDEKFQTKKLTLSDFAFAMHVARYFLSGKHIPQGEDPINHYSLCLSKATNHTARQSDDIVQCAEMRRAFPTELEGGLSAAGAAMLSTRSSPRPATDQPTPQSVLPPTGFSYQPPVPPSHANGQQKDLELIAKWRAIIEANARRMKQISQWAKKDVVRSSLSTGESMAHFCATDLLDGEKWRELLRYSEFKDLLPKKCSKGRSPAQLAAKAGNIDALVAIFQQDHESVCNQRSEGGDSILHFMAGFKGSITESARNAWIGLIQDIVRNGLALESDYNKNGLTAAQLASENGSENMLDVFLLVLEAS